MISIMNGQANVIYSQVQTCDILFDVFNLMVLYNLNHGYLFNNKTNKILSKGLLNGKNIYCGILQLMQLRYTITNNFIKPITMPVGQNNYISIMTIKI